MKLLFLLGAAWLLMTLIEKIYKKYWQKNLQIDIQFQDHPAVEGETAFLTETVENRKWFPVPVLQVEFQVDNGLSLGQEENASKSDKQYKRDVFTVSDYQKISRKIPFECLKRGYYEINQANITSRGIRLKDIYYEDVMQQTFLYVYPAKIAKKQTELPLQKLGGLIEKRKQMLEDPFAFAGIREYDTTDPMSRINWKASARSGDLMVNIRNSTYSSKVLCILDIEDRTLWHHEEIHETGIRLTAAMAGEVLKGSVPIALYSNGYDCLNQKEVRVSMGSGKGQLENINRVLSRIQLKTKQRVRPILEIIKEQKKEILEEAPVVVLITESQDEQLVRVMLDLAKNGVSILWIGTHYQEELWKGPDTSKITYVSWEVEHGG